MVVAEKPKRLIFADEHSEMNDWPLRAGLGWRSRKQANEIYRPIARGTMLVTGDRGSGKDLFAFSTAYLNKYYFGRRVLLDTPPKQAFGDYIPFDAGVMMQEINKMAKAAGVEGITASNDRKEYDEFIEEATKDWALEGEGYVLLKDSVLYLSELKRYCYKRNPHNKFNKFIGSINSVVRHLDMLVIGTHVYENEIDKYTYLQYANIRAKCSWCVSREHTAKVRVGMTGIIGADFAFGGVLYELPPLYIDGDAPRSCLDGKSFFDIFQSKSMSNLKPVSTKEM